MNRFGFVLASALLTCVLNGCGGGGIEEGVSTTGPTDEGGAPKGFREMMLKDADKMKMKGKPKTIPAAEKPAEKVEEKSAG